MNRINIQVTGPTGDPDRTAKKLSRALGGATRAGLALEKEAKAAEDLAEARGREIREIARALQCPEGGDVARVARVVFADASRGAELAAAYEDLKRRFARPGQRLTFSEVADAVAEQDRLERENKDLKDLKSQQNNTILGARAALGAESCEDTAVAATRLVRQLEAAEAFAEAQSKDLGKACRNRDEWKRVAETATDTIRELNKEINQTRRALGAGLGEDLVVAAKRARGGADADRRLDNVLSSGMASAYDSKAIQRAARVASDRDQAQAEVLELKRKVNEVDTTVARAVATERSYIGDRVLAALGGDGQDFGPQDLHDVIARVRKLAERRDRWRHRAEVAQVNIGAFEVVKEVTRDELGAQDDESTPQAARRLRHTRDAWRKLVCEFAQVDPQGPDAFGCASLVLEASADPSLATEAQAWRTRICDALGVRKDASDALAQCCERIRGLDSAEFLGEVRAALGAPQGVDVRRWARAVSESTLQHYRAAQELSEALAAVKARLQRVKAENEAYRWAMVLKG